LFSLPGELRNRIYDCILREQEELRYKTDDKPYRHYSAKNSNQEVNQLKYVCWQLRHETLSLELEIPTLVFPDLP
ncbi:hypothetical protein BCR34DRAFT_467514, partial [Clohesyomyces aquaticus]